MKRSGTLRRTRIARRTPLARVPFVSKPRTPGELPAGLGLGVRAGVEFALAPRPHVKPRKAARAIPFPRWVTDLVDKRDPWCQRCGSPGPLHHHHRRAKAKGGSRRPHTACPCNDVRLCQWLCHPFVHANPEQARAEGWIVPQSVDEPGRVAVMRGAADGGGASMYPTCAGEWAGESPLAGEAA